MLRMLSAMEPLCLLQRHAWLGTTSLPPAFSLLAITLLGVVVVSLVLLKFRQSLLLAYFICGVTIANSGIMASLGGEIVRDIPHLSEFGILLLLFTLGMEFSLGELRYLRRPAFLGGGLQIAITMVVALLAGWALRLQGAHLVVLTVSIALSSTAISVKVFQDHGLTANPGARFALAIAIFQDLFIIAFLVVLPLIFRGGNGDENEVATHFGWVAVKGICFVAAAFGLARWIIPRLLHAVARTRSRELFTLTVTGLCLGVALLAGVMELSLPLGAFVAGLTVSESIYKHRILSDILPIKDLFLTMFFVSVGLMIDLPAAWQAAPSILALAALLLVVKASIVFGIAWRLGLRPRAAVYAATGLASAGEFSLVLTQKVGNLSPWPAGVEQILLASMALSMGLVPVLMGVADRLGAWIEPRCKNRELQGKELLPPAKRVQKLSDHVIICGYGPVGQMVLANLNRQGIASVVIELNVDTVKALSSAGQPVLFADAKHEETWLLAGVPRARLVVFTFPDASSVAEALYAIRALKPEIAIIARCKFVADAQRLQDLGVNEVILDEAESGRAITRSTLGVYDQMLPD
jgi:monovalent cation:H+ antiporter-2, CPA2 family